MRHATWQLRPTQLQARAVTSAGYEFQDQRHQFSLSGPRSCAKSRPRTRQVRPISADEYVSRNPSLHLFCLLNDDLVSKCRCLTKRTTLTASRSM